MKHSLKVFLLFIMCCTKIWSQRAAQPGSLDYKNLYLSNTGSASKILNGDSSIQMSYTHSACGLNFVQASNPLYKRPFSFSVSINQPAAFVVSGIPVNAAIIKAFLYSGSSGNSSVFNATVTNPASTTLNFPMTLIGQGHDVCWGKCFANTYKADVTTAISGNGNYLISGMPTSSVSGCANEDSDGATLFIIYSDPTQNYTGNIVIADGAHTSVSAAVKDSITGFNVCGPTSLTSNFMIVGDLQKIAAISVNLNSSIPNYTIPLAAQTTWNFISDPGAAATVGQNSAIYGATNAGDCYFLAMAGMYYRSCCSTCTGNNNIILNASSTPSCPTSNATVTASGIAPFSYTWIPTSQTTSVATNLTAGNYTIYVKDGAACTVNTTTLLVSTCVGINETTKEDMHILIYPNPSKGWLNINSDVVFENYRVLDALGKTIKKDSFTSTIDLSSLSPGVYLINLTNKKGQGYYSKFIIADK